VPPACPTCAARGPFASPFSADPFRIYRCPSCALVFLHPLPDEEELTALYSEEYYGKSRRKFSGALESLVAGLTLLKWKRLRPLLIPGGRFLDIGCGRGTLVHLARAAGFEAYGLERHFPGTPFSPHIFYQELAECGFPESHFQLVVLWHVLEHLPRPAATLQEIHRVLRPGGFLSIAVPNFGGAQARASGKHWFHMDLPRHFWHFELPTLEKLLLDAGFHVVRRATLAVEYDWFGTLQSWLNRVAEDDNRFYSFLKGAPADSTTQQVKQLALASSLALPALTSALWDAVRGVGGTLSLLVQKTSDIRPKS
jgi:SAM-dependent methyltransferase